MLDSWVGRAGLSQRLEAYGRTLSIPMFQGWVVFLYRFYKLAAGTTQRGGGLCGFPSAHGNPVQRFGKYGWKIDMFRIALNLPFATPGLPEFRRGGWLASHLHRKVKSQPKEGLLSVLFLAPTFSSACFNA